MKVLDALRSKPNGNALADRLYNHVRPRALVKLEHIKDIFPHFTDHSIRHGDGVVRILDQLIPDSVKEQLNEWELYFLVAAAYLHDIGMVERCPASPSGDEWDKFYEDYKAREPERAASDHTGLLLVAKRDFVRDHHHQRSEEYIRNEWRELELRETDTPAEGAIIARLALGHRKVDLSDRSMFGEIPFGHQLIRRNLLAAYLRLADELDTTAFRTPWAEYEVVSVSDEQSALEWAKHLSISGIDPRPGVIVVARECHDFGVYLRLCKLHKDISEKLAELRRIIPHPFATGDGFVISDPLPYYDVELKVEHVGYLPLEIRFELQDREIIQLIMGERLYGDRTACIRELLQNAVDACREAKVRLPSSYSPKIIVAEEDDGRILTVTDNGMGMDEYIVRHYFARVGISYYKSPDFKGGFQPISEFGIGILSCFMMADRIEVDSKREGSEPIHLEISGLTEPFVPRRGSLREHGTEIRLHLKPDLGGTFDSYKRVRHFARHVEFPIEVLARDKTSHVVPDRGMVPTLDDLCELISIPEVVSPDSLALTQNDIEKASIVQDANGTRLGVTLLKPFQRAAIEVADVHHSDIRARFGLLNYRLVVMVSQQGFFVGNLASSFAGFADNTWCELNLGGEVTLPLTTDRTRVSRSEPGFWRRIAELYSHSFEDLYKRLEAPKSTEKWWAYHLSYYSNGLRHQGLPSAFKDSIYRQSKWCTLTQQGFRPRGVEEIVRWRGRVYAITDWGHRELERISKLLPTDACIVVVPPDLSRLMWVDDTRDGLIQLLEIPNVRSAQELINDLSIRYQDRELLHRRIRFVDAGTFLGKWVLGLSWPRSDLSPRLRVVDWVHRSPDRYGRFDGLCIDAHHPFSQVLLQYCNDNLPPRSRAIIEELLGRAVALTGRLAEYHNEAFRVLKQDGVVPVNATLEHVAEWRTGDHKCPYELLEEMYDERR